MCEAIAVIFERVVCGVDSSPESLEAARQAARLVEPGGRLVLVAVVEANLAVHAGFAAQSVLDQLREEAAAGLEAAKNEVAGTHAAETVLVEGPVVAGLLEQARSEQATLVCVGTHEHRRASGILLGSAATTLVHDAPMSVLVARAPKNPDGFPASIVAGVDGSEEAERAAEVALALAERFSVPVSLVAATRGKRVDPGAIQRARPDVTLAEARPVGALLEASEEADLLVVGSKGLHGVKALGSVSERVAHAARCSVLVVRGS